MPGEPAATPTAVVHLLTWRGRAGTSGDIGVLDQQRLRGGEGDPDVGHLDGAAAHGAAPCSSPGLSAAKVTVRSACTAAPGASPLSASTPEGMSMASTPAPGGTAGAS